jgi:isochorismate pyruvate lyase
LSARESRKFAALAPARFWWLSRIHSSGRGAASGNPQTDPAMNEPLTDRAPLRRFRDPAYQPLAATLAQLRADIDRLDDQIVALMAQRAMLVKDAARFKRDAGQVAAPARQAEVYARVRALAQAHNRGFENLPDVVEAAYRALVAGFIASEQLYFNQTDMIEDRP